MFFIKHGLLFPIDLLWMVSTVERDARILLTGMHRMGVMSIGLVKHPVGATMMSVDSAESVCQSRKNAVTFFNPHSYCGRNSMAVAL